MQTEPTLARKIGLPLLTLYGLGTILGAGIYVLVGKVAGASGLLAPLAFLVSALIALITGFSYAQMSALFPKSAGEVVYIAEGFEKRQLTILVGYLVILVGVVSAATLVNGFVGYLSFFFSIPEWLAISGIVLVLGAIAIWGIAESLWISALMTLIEIVGLLLVIVIKGDLLPDVVHNFAEYLIPISFVEVVGVLSGAFLAFYAFLGFEDMVNIAEEVKRPEENLPSAIFLAIVISTGFYLLIAFIAVAALPIEQLAASDAPLALLIQSESRMGGNVIAIISLCAITNGVLVQIIMASRVCYGMSAQALLTQHFSRVSPVTRTPINATLAMIVMVLVFALWLPLVTLAKLTSLIVLVVFFLVNVSLWLIKRSGKYQPRGVSYPIFGAILCGGLIVFQLISLLA